MKLGRMIRVSFLLLALGLPACGKDSTAIAKLETSTGSVDRDHAAKLGAFEPTERGEEFFVGDGVRTAAKATAALRLGDGSGLMLEESTLVRFLEKPSKGKQRMDIEMGQAVLTAGSQALDIETSFGNAVIQPNSKLLLTRSKAGTRFEVAIGSAVLDLKGQRTELSA